MEQIFFDVQGIGRVQLVHELGASLLVEDESGTRLSLPASRCVRVDQTAAALAETFPGRAASLAAVDAALAEVDALADQFTGLDMGAEMRAAEFDHMQTVAQVGQRVTSSAGVGRVKWVKPTDCGVVYFIQSEACPDCLPSVCLGDELQLLED